MYTKEQIVAHPCKQGFEKKGATQTDAESKKNSGDETDRATMRSTTHTPQLCLRADQKGDKTVEFLPKEPRIPENMVGTKNTNNFQKQASRPLLQNMTVDCPYNS